jgi:vacuolar-type H+-ATPase subunit D/Vma8
MTDEKADELAKRMLELDESRLELRKKYYGKLKKALSPVLAARFTQVEDQIEKLLDLQIDASLPIIEEADSK